LRQKLEIQLGAGAVYPVGVAYINRKRINFGLLNEKLRLIRVCEPRPAGFL
jgi:hypothetical protein